MVSLPPPNLDVNDDAALFGNHDVQFSISAQKAFYRETHQVGNWAGLTLILAISLTVFQILLGQMSKAVTLRKHFLKMK